MYINKEFEVVKKKKVVSEKSLENKVKKHLSTLDNVFFYKSFGGGFQIKGLPDIVCSINGHFVGLELKRSTGKPQSSQIICGMNIIKSNGIYIIIDNYNDYLVYIDLIINSKFKELYNVLSYDNIDSFLQYISNKYKMRIDT